MTYLVITVKLNRKDIYIYIWFPSESGSTQGFFLRSWKVIFCELYFFSVPVFKSLFYFITNRTEVCKHRGFWRFWSSWPKKCTKDIRCSVASEAGTGITSCFLTSSQCCLLRRSKASRQLSCSWSVKRATCVQKHVDALRWIRSSPWTELEYGCHPKCLRVWRFHSLLLCSLRGFIRLLLPLSWASEFLTRVYCGSESRLWILPLAIKADFFTVCTSSSDELLSRAKWLRLSLRSERSRHNACSGFQLLEGIR